MFPNPGPLLGVLERKRYVPTKTTWDKNINVEAEVGSLFFHSFLKLK